MDPRTLLAAALGAVLGVVLLAYPEAIIRAHTVGRTPHDRRGEYGGDDPPGRWRRLVQGLGVVALLFAAYFALSAAGVAPAA